MPFYNNTQELTPVVYGDYPAKILSHITLAAGEMAFTLHWHDRVEIHRVIKGSLELFCADEHIVLNAGDISVVSPRLLHRGIAGAAGVEYDVIMFDVRHLLNQTEASAQFLNPLCDGTVAFSPRIRSDEMVAVADRIISSSGYDNEHRLQTVGDLYAFIGLLYRYGTVRQGTPLGVEERFGRVIAYINEQFTHPISSATLSTMFGYDEAYFCRKFKAGTGITVMKYIRSLRLEHARRMLKETAQPISSVAAACGFADTAYFANCFKKQYGMTAVQWRGK